MLYQKMVKMCLKMKSTEFSCNIVLFSFALRGIKQAEPRLKSSWVCSVHSLLQELIRLMNQ